MFLFYSFSFFVQLLCNSSTKERCNTWHCHKNTMFVNGPSPIALLHAAVSECRLQYASLITEIADDPTVLCGVELELPQLELIGPRHELFFLGSYIFRSYQCIWESMPQSSFLSTAFLQPQNYKLLFQWTLLFQWYTSPCISHKKPAFHIKSLSILLDPYCEIETYAMNKKQEFVLSKGLHWVSIPSQP